MNARKDCTCRLAQHQHGTPAGYSVCGCHCLPCRVAYAQQAQDRRDGLRGSIDDRVRPAVSHVGTARRLQALHAVGWSNRLLAEHVGMSVQQLNRLHTTTTAVMPRTAQRIAVMYDELWDQRPPCGTSLERKAVTYAANIARRRGWALPMSWDDDLIDDPDARPHLPSGSSAWDKLPCGTTAAARRHYRRGEPLDEACRNAEHRDHQARKKAA